MRIGILTISDRASQGLREDLSGKMLANLLREIPAEVANYRVVPDEKNEIQAALLHFIDDLDCEVVLTTGGTGIGPRDVTPEATQEILEKEIPGLAEAFRREGLKKIPTALLSRGVSGIRKRSLIVNLPGSPEAVRDALGILQPILSHATELIRGEIFDCKEAREKKWS